LDVASEIVAPDLVQVPPDFDPAALSADLASAVNDHRESLESGDAAGAAEWVEPGARDALSAAFAPLAGGITSTRVVGLAALGRPPARQSYLSVERILAAARESGAQAVHPGYGFLSESWRFAEACARAGLTFIGPSAEAIRAMGDKPEARRRMAAAGVPIVPGSPEPVADAASAERVAGGVGDPVILRAAPG